jgi:hypothetical protein
MSRNQTVTDEYELEPDVDEELVAEIQTYSQRQNGDLVKGTIQEVYEGRAGKINVSVDLPSESFTERFHKPDPENKSFEAVANEYGIGLVDIGALKGETVWCTKEDGSWNITLYPGKKERLLNKLPSLSDATHEFKRISFSPVYASEIAYEHNQSKRYRRLYSKPPDDQIYWSKGVIDALKTVAFWMIILIVIGVILI